MRMSSDGWHARAHARRLRLRHSRVKERKQGKQAPRKFRRVACGMGTTNEVSACARVPRASPKGRLLLAVQPCPRASS